MYSYIRRRISIQPTWTNKLGVRKLQRTKWFVWVMNEQSPILRCDDVSSREIMETSRFRWQCTIEHIHNSKRLKETQSWPGIFTLCFIPITYKSEKKLPFAVNKSFLDPPTVHSIHTPSSTTWPCSRNCGLRSGRAKSPTMRLSTTNSAHLAIDSTFVLDYWTSLTTGFDSSVAFTLSINTYKSAMSPWLRSQLPSNFRLLQGHLGHR